MRSNSMQAEVREELERINASLFAFQATAFSDREQHGVPIGCLWAG